MTITYLNGTVLEAVVLSHDGQEIRAIAPGNGDVLAFTNIHDTWISDQLEPVVLEFAWQRRRTAPVPVEDDCICPRELAASLIATLVDGCEPDLAEPEAIFLFSPAGNREAAILSEQLQLM